MQAGHEPLLHHAAATHALKTIEHGRLALGVLSSAEYETIRVTLNPGDLLLLYTDGVALVGPREGEWSTEIRPADGPRQFIDRPGSAHRRHCSAPPHAGDDAALVALQFRGERIEGEGSGNFPSTSKTTLFPGAKLPKAPPNGRAFWQFAVEGRGLAEVFRYRAGCGF